VDPILVVPEGHGISSTHVVPPTGIYPESQVAYFDFGTLGNIKVPSAVFCARQVTLAVPG
jgi:hypothetical protein